MTAIPEDEREHYSCGVSSHANNEKTGDPDRSRLSTLNSDVHKRIFESRPHAESSLEASNHSCSCIKNNHRSSSDMEGSLTVGCLQAESGNHYPYSTLTKSQNRETADLRRDDCKMKTYQQGLGSERSNACAWKSATNRRHSDTIQCSHIVNHFSEDNDQRYHSMYEKDARSGECSAKTSNFAATTHCTTPHAAAYHYNATPHITAYNCNTPHTTTHHCKNAHHCNTTQQTTAYDCTTPQTTAYHRNTAPETTTHHCNTAPQTPAYQYHCTSVTDDQLADSETNAQLKIGISFEEKEDSDLEYLAMAGNVESESETELSNEALLEEIRQEMKNVLNEIH